MADLIGKSFDLHGIKVGPELPDAQLAPGSQGPYVRTLQGWLRLLATATAEDVLPRLGARHVREPDDERGERRAARRRPPGVRHRRRRGVETPPGPTGGQGTA